MAPLTACLAGLDAWVTAIRRDQTSARATRAWSNGTPASAWSRSTRSRRGRRPRSGTTSARTSVPYNPLHDQGYPSIGCHPCTSRVADGEADRSGRWRGHREDRVRPARRRRSRARDERSARDDCGTAEADHAPAPARRAATLFPAFLKLAGRRVLVVGAGPVAASKLEGLLSRGRHREGRGARRRRRDRAGAGRNRPPARLRSRPIWTTRGTSWRRRRRQSTAPWPRPRAARRLFVNAVDDPANASVYLGAVVRRDGFTLAISTDGQAPALAGLLREGLDAVLPHDLDAWLRVAQARAQRWRAEGVPMEQRASAAAGRDQPVSMRSDARHDRLRCEPSHEP